MIVEVDRELEEIFPRYLRNRQEDLLKIKAGLDRSDFVSLVQISHKIAGNASGYGLTELGLLAKKLEAAAREQRLESCEALARTIKAYLTDIVPKFV